MAKLVWDQTGDRVYETGLDRGVLYFIDGGGVPWNGVTSVDEQSTKKIESVYYDGVKINDIVINGEYSATLKAYTYPEEFLQFEGIEEEQRGVYFTDQPGGLFHLSYRTRIGNDVDGIDQGYKLHLLWNLTAIPSTKTYETLSIDVGPEQFEWSLTSVPEEIDHHRPTSHMILDSRRVDRFLLEDIESFLYGDEDTDPVFPSLKGLTSFIRKWDRLIIVDNGDGTWTAVSGLEGVIEMLDTTTFQINNADATYSDADTYTITSSDKNEEDI